MKIYRECEGIPEPEEDDNLLEMKQAGDGTAQKAEPAKRQPKEADSLPEDVLPEDVYDGSTELPELRGPFTREELTNGNVRIGGPEDRSDKDESEEYWNRIRRV